MSTYNPTPEDMTRDIIAAAKFVFDIDLNPKDWYVSDSDIRKLWRYKRLDGCAQVLFNGEYYPIGSAEDWRKIIGCMLARANIIKTQASGITLVKTNSTYNIYNFPREITHAGSNFAVYCIADIKKTRTIRNLRAGVFGMNLTPALLSIVDPLRADWIRANNILTRPAPVPLEQLIELKKKPVFHELDAIVGPLSIDLVEALDRWYSAACLRYVAANANYVAEREAAEHSIAEIGDKIVAAADLQKWYVDGELISAADIPI